LWFSFFSGFRYPLNYGYRKLQVAPGNDTKILGEAGGLESPAAIEVVRSFALFVPKSSDSCQARPVLGLLFGIVPNMPARGIPRNPLYRARSQRRYKAI
jgi:hypothetical protein